MVWGCTSITRISRFIVAILESCSHSAKENLRARLKYSEALGNYDLLQIWRRILNEKFAFKWEYAYSVTCHIYNASQSKSRAYTETLDHFTKMFVDLLNIFKGAGSPTDERNKVIFFSMRWRRALAVKRSKNYETESVHPELGQQLLRQQVARENYAASKSLSGNKFDPTGHGSIQNWDQDDVQPSTVLGGENDCYSWPPYPFALEVSSCLF